MTGQSIDPMLTLSPLQNYPDSPPQAGPLGTTHEPAAKEEFLDYDIDNATTDLFYESGDSSKALVSNLPRLSSYLIGRRVCSVVHYVGLCHIALVSILTILYYNYYNIYLHYNITHSSYFISSLFLCSATLSIDQDWSDPVCLNLKLFKL